MGMLILSVIASFIPTMLLYFWFTRQDRNDPEYKTLCRKTLFAGMLSVIPVTFVSMFLHITQNLLLRGRVSQIVIDLFYKFIVLAFAEELVKTLTGRKILKQRGDQVSRLDCAAFMAIAACGFNLIESIVYSIGSDVITVLVRGATALHEFYGLIIGWYFGKYLETKNKKYLWTGFGISWFLHGLYDFSLTESLLSKSDFFYFLPFIAIIVTWIIGIRILIKVIKARKDPSFTEPLSAMIQ